jgi:hypothetical protein
MKYLELCQNFIEENSGYEFFGIRADDRQFTVGDVLPISYVWDDGKITDERLDGTCAIKLYDYWTEKYNDDAESLINNYPFDHVYIITSKGCQEGGDRDELIMYEAVVVFVIK